MNGLNFEKLVDLVCPGLEKDNTQLRKAIPIEKRVAVALGHMSTGNSFCTVSKTFAVRKSTAVTITREFFMEIFRLSPRFVKFLISQLETAKAMEDFKQDCNCKIPQALGPIGGTHIFIQTLENKRKYDYYCRKQCYSVNVQAIVGVNLLFLHVGIGFPGSMHDSQVLRHSSLFQRAEHNEVLKNLEDIIDICRSTPSFTWRWWISTFQMVDGTIQFYACIEQH